MISQETKDQIENEALEYSKANSSNGVIEQEYRYCFEDYSAGATQYAEKLEEKDKIIESKDRELAQLKEIAERMAIKSKPTETEIEQQFVNWFRTVRGNTVNAHDGFLAGFTAAGLCKQNN